MDKTILNLSKIPLTRSIRDEGVYNLPTTKRVKLHNLLEFNHDEIKQTTIFSRAKKIANLAEGQGVDKALVDPPQFMNSAIEHHLRKKDVKPLYIIMEVKSFKEKSEDEDDLYHRNTKFEFVKFISPPERNFDPLEGYTSQTFHSE